MYVCFRRYPVCPGRDVLVHTLGFIGSQVSAPDLCRAPPFSALNCREGGVPVWKLCRLFSSLLCAAGMCTDPVARECMRNDLCK
jgi:hypothetical protein